MSGARAERVRDRRWRPGHVRMSETAGPTERIGRPGPDRPGRPRYGALNPSGRHGLLLGEDGDLGLFRQHHAEDLLQSEQMHAGTRALEVVAGAMPLTSVETDVMGVVVATEGERETVDGDPIQLARVAIRLLDLADQRAVHRRRTSVALWALARPPSGRAPRPGMTVVRPLYTPTRPPEAAEGPQFTRLVVRPGTDRRPAPSHRSRSQSRALAPPPRRPGTGLAAG